MGRKPFILTLILILSLLPISFTSQGQDTANIAVVYSAGGLGDQSFNDMAKQGIDMVVAEYGSQVNIVEACEAGCDFSQVNQAIIDFADSGEYDMIIGIGFGSTDGIRSAAQEHLGTKFVIIDSIVDLANVASVIFSEH